MIAIPIPASPQKSSSMATGRVRPLSSPKAFIKKSTPYRPILAASSTIGQGNSSRSSHSWAAGRMTSAANSWIHFWICCWSSLRFREKSLMAPSYSLVTIGANGFVYREGMERPVRRRSVILGGAAFGAVHLFGRRVAAGDEIALDGPATMGTGAGRGPSTQLTDPPIPPIDALAGLFVTHVDVDRRMLSLTFDDGPSPSNTPIILDTLAAAGIKATFFLIGVNVRAFPDIARRIVDEGHEVANHSVFHTPYSAGPLSRQIGDNQEIIREATGVTPTAHRAPGLTRGAPILEQCRVHGVFELHTHMDTNDWRTPRRSASNLIDEFGRNLRNGATPIYHDGGARRPTADAVPGFIRIARDRGYELVTVAELVRAGIPQPATPFYTSGGVGGIGVVGIDTGSGADGTSDTTATGDLSDYCPTCEYDARAELVAALEGGGWGPAERRRIVEAIADYDLAVG
uniref:Cellulase/chitin deacetylase n=1 Tax=uncultured microorganism TaxID=358574 RepID=A0A0B4ZN67_9ZZZZ|nr:cellulase/chitin deacetylase [uncultured microorganism]